MVNIYLNIKSNFYLNLFSLNKDENQRPKYQKLLEHPFVQNAKEPQQAENTAAYLSEIIDGLSENTDTFELYYYLPSNLSSSSSSSSTSR
jgi:hypothetical protein